MHVCVCVQLWSELLAPLINMIKDDYKNVHCLSFMIFYLKKNHINLTFY